MQLIKDMLGFIKSLSQIDLLLYFAVLVLIILIVSLLYIIKNSEEEEEEPRAIVEPKKEEIDLKSIVQEMEQEPPTLKLTDYEAEQEEKAIISYEELLAKKDRGQLTYDEETNDEVSIKKINLNSLMDEPPKKEPVSFYSYEREEEFLKKLKALNELLS